MARSLEALRRRAEKRNRSLEEQKQAEVDGKVRKNPRLSDPRLSEDGAWKCPKCGFSNFASREKCRGESCQQPRPKQKPQNDVSRSNWPPQADDVTKNTNQSLRERYQNTKGEGMTEEDIERAKVLLARDERKKHAKLKKQTKGSPKKEKKPPLVVRQDNKTLREKYQKTNGVGMTKEEIERAKILVTRDERKRQKRLEALEKS